MILKIGTIQLRNPLRSPFYRPQEEKPRSPTYWMTDEEVLARYGEPLGRAILSLKKSVGRQKRHVEGRWVRAKNGMFWLSGAILVFSTLATVFGGLSVPADQEWWLKTLRIVLPATIALLTGFETLLDIRARYAREALAQLKLTRLQSDIEYALVWDDQPDAAKPGERKITHKTVEEWKISLDGVLDTVSSEYIAANSKAAARGTQGK